MADNYAGVFLRGCNLQEYENSFVENRCHQEVEFLNLTRARLESLIPNEVHRGIFEDYWRNTLGFLFGAEPPVIVVGQQLTDLETRTLLLTIISHDTVLSWITKYESGRFIVARYQKKKELTESQRNSIVADIVRELQENTHLWKNEHFLKIAKCLAGKEGIFPTEAVATYFIPPKPSRIVNGKKIPGHAARGKIPNRYKNQLSNKRVIAGTVVHRQKHIEDVNPVPVSIDASNSVQTSVKWLSENEGPKDEYLHHWHATFRQRRQDILSNDTDVVLKKWSGLKNPELAAQLMKQDFADCFVADVNAVENFNEFFKTIKEVHKERTDGNIKKYEDLADDAIEHISKDHRLVAQLSLLCYYYPPKTSVYISKNAKIGVGARAGSRANTNAGTSSKDNGETSDESCAEASVEARSVENVLIKEKSKKGDNSEKHCNRFSSADAVESIVQLVDVPSDVENLCDEVKKKHNLQPVQPYIIVVGKCTGYAHAYLVVMNNEILLTKSMAEALDLTFKIFHVFNLDYPKASLNTWKLIEQGLYRLKVEYDEISDLAYILNKLNDKYEEKSKEIMETEDE